MHQVAGRFYQSYSNLFKPNSGTFEVISGELEARGLYFFASYSINQSINQSKRIYIAPYVAGESEARVGLG